ncbi:CHAT domain-containing protein [Cyathus striatus]|nr:CHAT domain-containing protein [Cyathus striatus]
MPTITTATEISPPRGSSPKSDNGLSVSAIQSKFDSVTNYIAPRNIEAINIDIALLEKISSGFHGGDVLVKAAYMTNMGVLLVARFDITGEISDIEKAITLQNEALDLIPDDNIEKIAALWNLGNSYQSRYERTDIMNDLEVSINLHEKVLSATEQDDQSYSRRAGNLGISMMRRFERAYDFSDIDRAVKLQEKSVASLPDGHPLRAACLINLGNALQCRYENSFDTPDIDEAIRVQRQALSLLQESDPDRPLCLTNLGNSLMQRFDQNANMSDINLAISFQEDAVRVSTQKTEAMARRLVNLGVAYTKRFEVSAELIDIDRAIASQEHALEITLEGHSHMPGRLTNLGTAYMKRYERSKNIYDVLKAIPTQERAVKGTSSDSKILKARRLTNLGASYQRLFEESLDMVDINKAIESHREAIGLLDDALPDRLLYMNNLGFSLMRRFEQSKAKADIDESISVQKDALQHLKEDEGRHTSCANNLANSLQCRFELTNDIDDLEQAIALQKDVVSSTPDWHAQKAVRINNLARSYVHRYQFSNESRDIAEAIEYYKQAALSSTGIPAFRLEAAIGWASATLEIDPSKSLDAYSVAIDLIPTVTWLGQTIPMRHVDLASLSDLSGEAAAIAISLGRYDLALEWLENGRNVVWAQLNHLKTPLDALRTVKPGLADKLAQLSENLAKAGTREVFPDDASLEEEGQHHRRLAEEWNDAVVEARTVTGFENFMKGRKFSDVQKHLSLLPGNIAIINVSKRRCDALLLSNKDSEIQHLPLALSYTAITELQNAFARRLDQNHLKARGSRGSRVGYIDHKGFVATLRYLWVACVSPILSALKIDSAPCEVKHMPRIWWCTTGPLSFLPIHAAGIYNINDPYAGSKVYEHVVSSYTPTVWAILEPLLNKSKLQSNQSYNKPTILAVSQPKTPGKSPLPGTIQEIQQIKNIFDNSQNKISVLEGPAGTVQTVIEGMKDCSWVHLACHANQNLKEPTKSAFQLYDAALPLSIIINTPLHSAEFAFLSACQTSAGSENLAEESVHLAAGMLVAGYRGVIATMWSIRDRDGPIVAKEVYSFLLSGDHIHSSEHSAQALHHAMDILRKDVGLLSFLAWVPFIHVGI